MKYRKASFIKEQIGWKFHKIHNAALWEKNMKRYSKFHLVDKFYKDLLICISCGGDTHSEC